MRPLSSTPLILLSSLPRILSQQLSFLPTIQHASCQHLTIASANRNFIYFTSPNESDFHFSIYTEWDRWYPNVLRGALLQAGFSLGLPENTNESMTADCGWHNAGTVTVGAWQRGTITYKDVTVPAKTQRPRPPLQHPPPQHPNPQRPPVVNITASHVSRQVDQQPFGHGHPLSYFLAYQLGAPSFLPRINRTTRVVSNTTSQSLSQSQMLTIPPTAHHALPRAPPHLPQKQTLDLICTILLTTSPEADIALFLMKIIGIVLLFCILAFLGHLLGGLLSRLSKPDDEEGHIQLEPMRTDWEDSDGTLTDGMKPELARVVAKGDERFYTAKSTIGMPRSSSVYSRSVDGMTLC